MEYLCACVWKLDLKILQKCCSTMPTKKFTFIAISMRMCIFHKYKYLYMFTTVRTLKCFKSNLNTSLNFFRIKRKQVSTRQSREVITHQQCIRLTVTQRQQCIRLICTRQQLIRLTSSHQKCIMLTKTRQQCLSLKLLAINALVRNYSSTINLR